MIQRLQQATLLPDFHRSGGCDEGFLAREITLIIGGYLLDNANKKLCLLPENFYHPQDKTYRSFRHVFVKLYRSFRNIKCRYAFVQTNFTGI
jgi:hypothetical protein